MTAPANSIGTGRTPAVRHEAGRQVALLDARGSLNTSLYDARGLLAGTQDPLGAWTTFQHDARGDQSLRVDARGWPTTYAVDPLGRQVGALYRDGGRVTNTYDAAGQQLTMQDRTGITTYAWDGAGRQSAVVHSIGLALTYTHDPAGNRATMLGPDGVTTYAWDANNRVSGVVNPYGEVTTLGYDALDRQVQLAYGNGMVASHAYDAAGRETALQYLDAAGTPLQWFTATYDPAGNRLTQLSLDGVGRTYTYDAAGQLTEEARAEGAAVDAVSYTYDGVGNRLTREGATEYRYNEASELVGVTAPGMTPITETWDANGNRATFEKGYVTTYAWDEENKLTRKEDSSGGSTAVTTYGYLADGRRVRKATPEETALYACDGWNVAAIVNAALEVQSAYTHLPGDWAGLLSDRRLRVSRFYGFDLQGSTALLVAADGSVLVRQEYPAFGGPGADTTTPFWYVGNQGYQWDGGALEYAGHGVVDMDEGRWGSRDPLLSRAWTAPSAYVYAGNRPTARVDAGELGGGGLLGSVVPPLRRAASLRWRWPWSPKPKPPTKPPTTPPKPPAKPPTCPRPCPPPPRPPQPPAPPSGGAAQKIWDLINATDTYLLPALAGEITYAAGNLDVFSRTWLLFRLSAMMSDLTMRISCADTAAEQAQLEKRLEIIRDLFAKIQAGAK